MNAGLNYHIFCCLDVVFGSALIQFAGGLNVLDWNKQVTPTPTA